jgi:signal transduction histidine kinase
MRRVLTAPGVARQVPRIHVVGVSTELEPAPRVLVVENDPAARATFDSLLGTRWAVTLTDRGDEARDRAQATTFDLVIANVEVPGMSGLDLARSLRANRATHDVPFILVSHSGGQRETVAALEAGADDFLITPFSERELLVRVQTRLELTAMRRRNALQEEILAGLNRKIHARDEFLSAASHELRTPITTLNLQTEGLLAVDSSSGQASALNERLRRRLGAIRRQVVRLNQLVDQLLDVSQFIEGRLDLHPEEIDLQTLVIDAIDLMRDSATSAGSPLLLRLHNEVVGCWDRVRLSQVITNLISNAIKFGSGRPIEVVLDADNAQARLDVRDSGEGIPLQEQERIFERFERATSVNRHPGLGLGLWICKQIVDACHGTISVQSEPGRGSTFSVQLPRGS